MLGILPGHFLQSAPTFLSPLITPRLLGGVLSLDEMPAFKYVDVVLRQKVPKKSKKNDFFHEERETSG